MAKAKSTTIGEYIIEIADKGTVKVYRIPKVAKTALKDCADKAGVSYTDTATTQSLGKKILTNCCDGEASGTIGEYHLERRDDGHIDVYQEYSNTKGALREISELIGFEYDKEWGTQQFGANIVKFAEENGPFKIKKGAARAEAPVADAAINSDALNAVKDYDLFNIELKKIDFELTDDEIEKHRDEVDVPGVVVFTAVMVDDPDYEEQVIIGVGDAADLLYDAKEMDERYKGWNYRPGEVFYAKTFDVLNSDTKFFDRFDDLGAIMAGFIGDMGASYTYSGKKPALVRVEWKERDLDLLYIINKDGTESDDNAPIDIETFAQLVSALKAK